MSALSDVLTFYDVTKEIVVKIDIEMFHIQFPRKLYIRFMKIGLLELNF